MYILILIVLCNFVLLSIINFKKYGLTHLNIWSNGFKHTTLPSERAGAARKRFDMLELPRTSA